MATTNSHEGRSGAVRRRARSHLAQLRQDRLAKRGVAAPEKSHIAVAAPDTVPEPGPVDVTETAAAFAPAPEPDAPAEPESPVENIFAPDPERSESASSPEDHPAGMPDPEEDPVADTEAAPDPDIPTDAAPVAAEDDSETCDSAPDESATWDSGPDAPATCDAAQGPTSTPDPAPQPQEAPAIPTQSELFALPGAGSGLVWMLQNAGINTLDDLAGVDADKLSADLGLIGQILDVRDWIAFARARG